MVGPTTLQPGETTTLALPMYMGMHAGMGGPHTFGVDVKSNDPTQPVTRLQWRFDAR